MCTVTIFPTSDNDFVLTSNRDEAPNRKTLRPDVYLVNNTKMLFPKDEFAGGSWIGVSDKNRLLCVLNGGFTYHKRQSAYRLSRGVVMRDLLSCDDIKNAIEAYNLEGVEPFTLVISDWNNQLQFFELVWDGKHKHFKELPLQPRIWSSSTLYLEKMKQERQQWFEDFKQTNNLDAESILQFHTNTHTENTEYGVIMDRLFVKTTSITQVVKEKDSVHMAFNNLQEGTISHHNLNIS